MRRDIGLVSIMDHVITPDVIVDSSVAIHFDVVKLPHPGIVLILVKYSFILCHVWFGKIPTEFFQECGIVDLASGIVAHFFTLTPAPVDINHLVRIDGLAMDVMVSSAVIMA